MRTDMDLFKIARTYNLAPEGQDGAAGAGGAQPAAGAGEGGGGGGGAAPAAGAGSALVPAAGATKDGAGSAAGDGAAKTGDQKGDGKTGDGAAPAKATEGQSAAEFKITLPDGVKVDGTRLESFTKFAKDNGLSSEQASKAVAEYAKMQADDAKAWEAQDAKWHESLKGDKTFGGSNYDASVAAAQKAVVKFGGEELAKDLERLGIGNLPSLARAFARVGKAMSEDSAHVAVETPKPKPSDAKTRLASMYDSPDSQKARAGQSHQ
jgi:hypothetical protein